MIDVERLALFLKQTNVLRDALYSENKEQIADAIKEIKFTQKEHAAIPEDIRLYHQGLMKRATDFLESENQFIL